MSAIKGVDFNPRIPQSEVNPLNLNECAPIGRFCASVWCKNGKYKSRRQLEEKCSWKKSQIMRS